VRLNRNAVGVLLGLTLLTLISVLPALPVLTKAIIGDGGDNYQFLGFQYLGHLLLSSGTFESGWTNYWRYPVGIQFQSAADSMGLVAIGAILYRFTDDAVLVYNLSIILLLGINVFMSYVAFRTWFSSGVAFTGTIIYGLSFFTLAKIGGHVNLLATAGFPLFFSALYRIWRDDGRLRDFGLLAVASVYLALTSLQYPLILIGALPFLIALLFIFDRTRLIHFGRVLWSRKAVVVGTVCLVVIAIVPFHGRKLLEFLRGQTILPSTELVYVSPMNFIFPNAYIPVLAAAFPNGSKPWIESSVFIGFAEMILVVVAISRLTGSPEKRFLSAAAIVLLFISLGKQPILERIWLYPHLFRWLPFRGIIEPARFYVLFDLALTFLILTYLERMRNTRLLLLVGLLVLVERLPLHFHLSPSRRDPAMIEAVRSRPTHAVLDLPVYTTWWYGQVYDLYSVYYQRPIVNGYFHWSADRPESQTLVRNLGDLACRFDPSQAVQEFDLAKATRERDETLETLIKDDIRIVVIHKDLFGSHEQCGAASRYIDALLEEKQRWEVLLDSPTRRVLWLRG
jgi:hypothetical protein